MQLTAFVKALMALFIVTIGLLWWTLTFAKYEGQTYLMRAAKEGHPIGLVKFLLAVGADPNARATQLARAKLQIAGATPLMFAAETGNVAAVRVLLQSGANPNAVDDRGWSPICGALYDWQHGPDVVSALFAGGARVPTDPRSAQHCLAAPNREQKLETLKQQGVYLDVNDRPGTQR